MLKNCELIVRDGSERKTIRKIVPEPCGLADEMSAVISASVMPFETSNAIFPVCLKK